MFCMRTRQPNDNTTGAAFETRRLTKRLLMALLISEGAVYVPKEFEDNHCSFMLQRANFFNAQTNALASALNKITTISWERLIRVHPVYISAYFREKNVTGKCKWFCPCFGVKEPDSNLLRQVIALTGCPPMPQPVPPLTCMPFGRRGTSRGEEGNTRIPKRSVRVES